MNERDDPVEEIRAIREEYARQFNHDLQAIFEDLKEHERQEGRRVVSFPPRRVEPIGAEAVPEEAVKGRG